LASQTLDSVCYSLLSDTELDSQKTFFLRGWGAGGGGGDGYSLVRYIRKELSEGSSEGTRPEDEEKYWFKEENTTDNTVD